MLCQNSESVSQVPSIPETLVTGMKSWKREQLSEVGTLRVPRRIRLRDRLHQQLNALVPRRFYDGKAKV